MTKEEAWEDRVIIEVVCYNSKLKNSSILHHG
jgi:hypothetical protein